MKHLIAFFLIPFSIWADYLFVLYDVGETVALKPVMSELIARGEVVRVLTYGGRERYEELSPEELCDAEVLVTGTASKIQLQYIQHCSGKTIAYYDNPLSIETISYAPLIREFENAVDLFLVPSRAAAESSHAEHIEIVGNPDLDQYTDSMPIQGLITYFGGYDPDYEAAFKAFLNYVAPLDYEVIVRPHPKTDGSLERGLIEGFSHVTLEGSDLSAVEAVAQSEIVACHRSSMAVKAASAGKEVICIDSEGNITHPPTREELGIPSESIQRFLRFL